MGSKPEENPLPKGSGSTVEGSFSGLANPNAGPLLPYNVNNILIVNIFLCCKFALQI